MNERHPQRGRGRELDLTTELERRARQVFDRSAAELDAPTRSRLTEARFRALQELRPTAPPRGWRWSLAPAGGLVAIALAAWMVVRQGDPGTDAAQWAALGDLEILLGDENLEMLGEDLDFYAWLEQQPELDAAGTDDDGIG